MDDMPASAALCLFLLGALMGGCAGCSISNQQALGVIKDKRPEIDRIIGNNGLTPKEKDTLLMRLIEGKE